MRATQFVVAVAALAGLAAGSATAQDLLKVSVPQRGSWDTGISELGQRIADAVQLKFIAAPLSARQSRELVQMPAP
jgi:hypothetical protein